MIKRHTRPNPQRNIKGGIAEREGSVHASNVMVVAPRTTSARASDRRWWPTEETRVRVAIKTGEVLDK